MNGLLERIVAASRARGVEPAPAMRVRRDRPSLAAALRGRHRIALLAEWKRRSPSAGALAAGVDVVGQVRRYAAAGAAALSIVTEPTEFAGDLADLRAAAAATTLPILRKDFLVTPEQVVESAAHGASAVLLIVRFLTGRQLVELAAACREHGLETLLECHTAAEIERALAVPDALVGVNNRDLDTLRIHSGLARELLPLVPGDRVAVAESGYTTPAQLDGLRGLCDAVLVGTVLMRGASAAAFCPAGSR